jgi:hypothetical protein
MAEVANCWIRGDSPTTVKPTSSSAFVTSRSAATVGPSNQSDFFMHRPLAGKLRNMINVWTVACAEWNLKPASVPRESRPERSRSGDSPAARTRGLVCRSLQSLHQPGNNDLLEDQRVRPHSDLAAQMASARIYPRIFRDVPLAQEKIFIVDRDLRIEDARDDEHRRHRFAEQSLAH